MPDEAPLPSLIDLTPLSEAYRNDPYPILNDLRTRCPVQVDVERGNILFTRYADVRATVNDRSLWADPLKGNAESVSARMFAGEVDRTLPRSETTSILMLDDPDHARIRHPLAQALYARVARCRPEVEAIVDGALDRLPTGEPFDLMAEFCVPIPIDVIASILGVDHARLVEFRGWSEGIIQSLNPFRSPAQAATMDTAREAMNAYFEALIAERRLQPRDDLISDMTRLQADGATLSDTELRINLSALLVGGNLTTTDLIGNGVRLLLTHPGELAKLKADPKLATAAVEEVLRYDPPVDSTGRIASADAKIAGRPMATGQWMSFHLRAANRDPEVFDDPDRFDITRKHRPHVAFGGGEHICIGAPLARLEAQVAVAKLFQRLPNLRLADPQAAPIWRTLPFFRGLQRLDVIG